MLSQNVEYFSLRLHFVMSTILSCRPEWRRCEAVPKRRGDICELRSTFCISEMDD